MTNRQRRLGAACLVLAGCFVSTAWAQSPAELPGLYKRFTTLYQARKFAEAVAVEQRILTIIEKTRGRNDPGVAIALSNLALVYVNLGRERDAEPLYNRALAIQEKTLGPTNIGVATTLNNLGTMYSSLGRYADAEPVLKRALAIYEKVPGPNEANLAIALNNLGLLYNNQRRYVEAEQLYKRALEIDERTLGPTHLNMATPLSNLAFVYRRSGRLAEAESLYKQALAIQEKAAGPDHPDVASSLNSLAGIYNDEGRYAQAEPLYKRALAIREKALGPDEASLASLLNDLAALYSNQSRDEEAAPLYRRALAIDERVLGPDNPTVATILNNLALQLNADSAHFADAELLLRRALAIREKAFGPDHPHVAATLINLASLYYRHGRDGDAEPLAQRAVAILEISQPDSHWLAGSLMTLEEVYSNEGRYADAELLGKRALAIEEKVFGPDHPFIRDPLRSLSVVYRRAGRPADAEPLLQRALTIAEKVYGVNHPRVSIALNDVVSVYGDEGRFGDAVPLIERTIAANAPDASLALPVLHGAQAQTVISAGKAIEESLNVVQRAHQSSAGVALNALAARFSAGTDRLAELVRRDQDLANEADSLDKMLIAAVSKEPALREAAAEQKFRDDIVAITRKRSDLGKLLARDFPGYVSLANPEPLALKDIQPLLADDEVLITISLDGKKSYIWAITRGAENWKELAITSAEASKQVSALRDLLDVDSDRPFDTQASFALYREILGPVEDIMTGKPRLSLVLDGALTSLPPQLLVTRDPTGKKLKDVDWLIRTHSVTVLPSIASLKVLRGKSAIGEAARPLIGFANPIFDPSSQQLAENPRLATEVAVARGIRGTVADVAELRKLPPLQETAAELKQVAASVHADAADLFTGAAATETRVKQEKLDQFRIVYFATHGLLAGDVAEYAKLNAEPALVLSLPEHPTELDDGLLTASEVAQLKLNADWVVLSACNTASAEKPGAEALSGLARAFFYAGARSLVVSNWEVESQSAVALMTGTFAALAANPKLSHGEALRKSMLAIIDNTQHPEWADPKYWAPFVVVGEPAKPAN